MSSLLPIVKLNNVQGKVARNRYLSTHLIIFKAKWRFLQLGGHYPLLGQNARPQKPITATFLDQLDETARISRYERTWHIVEIELCHIYLDSRLQCLFLIHSDTRNLRV